MSSPRVLFGFHAVTVRLKTAPGSIVELYVDGTRRDARMRQFVERAKEAGVRLLESDELRDEVEDDMRRAESFGIQGVPFFAIDERYGISGAQSAEFILATLKEAWREGVEH